ncbi:MAG: hypothetical protein IJ722_03425 [Alloprevotella sp.]|nr:hypothetical protein [Alloprevotella sp.]
MKKLLTILELVYLGNFQVAVQEMYAVYAEEACGAQMIIRLSPAVRKR